MIFIGHDWAEAHHDICVEDDQGTVLAQRRFPENVDGLAKMHELIGEHAGDASDVVVGTETDRGFFALSMVAAGYEVHAINPLSASRYRDRHGSSRAKSDRSDAKMLAEIVRADRHNHRSIGNDSDEAKVIGVLARTHQNFIWDRQRQANMLRSTLREFYPGALGAFGDNLESGDAVEVLIVAPSPSHGRKLPLSQIESALRRGGRQRSVKVRAIEIQQHLRAEHLGISAAMSEAFAVMVKSTAKVLGEMNRQIKSLEQELANHFEKHPDAEIICSLPGLGTVLGARALGEFGDDPNRYVDAKSRKNSAGTSPITRASGIKRVVVRRIAKNNRRTNACHQWAFCALSQSPGARAFYERLRAKGNGHNQALRTVANRLVGILHGCLTHRTLYDEAIAWPSLQEAEAKAA